MRVLEKSVSATNAHTLNTYRYDKHIMALNGLQALREMAWELATKYKWDPALKQAHQEYLTMLDGILEECES